MSAFATVAGIALMASFGCDAEPTDDPAPSRGMREGRPHHEYIQQSPAEAADDGASSGTQSSPMSSCRRRKAGGLTFGESLTVPGGIARISFLGPSAPVVDRTGRATVLYSSPGWDIRTASDPPAIGDPQDPSPDFTQTSADYGDHLAVDRAGNRTLAYLDYQYDSMERGQVSDLVITNQIDGGTWSETLRLDERGVQRVDLTVNNSGTAVLMWDEQLAGSGQNRLFVMYRPGADAAWTKPERLPVHHYFHFEASLDADGRLLVVYDDWNRGPNRVFAVLRDTDGNWSSPHPIVADPKGDRADQGFFRVARSTNGAAIITHGPTDGESAATDLLYTTRLNADGTWQVAVLQPAQLGFSGVEMDGRGRALLASWRDTTLWARWGRPDGTWLKPFALATGLGDRELDARGGRWPTISLNRTGDALAVWATGMRTPAHWVRYKPAGRSWTKPQKLATGHEAQIVRATLGDCGHATFTWTTPGKPRKVHLMSAVPQP